MIDIRVVPPSAFPSVLEGNLRRLVPPHKMYRYFLRALRWHFEADAAWLVLRLRRNRRMDERWLEGDGALCEEGLLEPFARLERPPIPRNIVLAPLRVHERVAGVVGVATRHRPFGVGRGRALNRMTALLAGELGRRDRQTLARVLERIQGKALSGIPLRDLAYHILDALHQLIGYDHSAALLRYDPQRKVFRVEAEKIVWRKAKSGRIGGDLALPLMDRPVSIEVPASKPELHALWCNEQSSDAPQPTSLLMIPLLFRKRLIGTLTLMNRERLAFDAYDQEVLGRFLPVSAFCLGTG